MVGGGEKVVRGMQWGLGDRVGWVGASSHILARIVLLFYALYEEKTLQRTVRL